MAALRKRSRTVTATEPPQAMNGKDDQLKISEYELSREQRIRENRERMEKLGIFDLSLSLKLKPQPPHSRRSPSIPKSPLPLNPSVPTRRSSRLQNVAREKVERAGSRRIVIEEGSNSKSEVYTEEHEKLLGNTEKIWVLFVDGVGKDGKRIYDSVQGKTCHHCRQKTLRYWTRCCNCNMVQGQFFGDCLYMRQSGNEIHIKIDSSSSDSNSSNSSEPHRLSTHPDEQYGLNWEVKISNYIGKRSGVMHFPRRIGRLIPDSKKTITLHDNSNEIAYECNIRHPQPSNKGKYITGERWLAFVKYKKLKIGDVLKMELGGSPLTVFVDVLRKSSRRKRKIYNK